MTAQPAALFAPRGRSGVTLIELLVTLVLLSLLFGMSATLAAHLERDDRDALSTQPARFRAQVTSARQQALRTGQVVTVDVADGGNRGDRSRGRLPSTYVVTAFPDGSVLAESLPLAGVVLNQLNGSLMKEGRNAAP